MTTSILIGIAILAVLVLIAAARQPDNYHVSRSERINAPAAVLFEQVNDLNQFLTWSPFVDEDPEARQTIAGASLGIGSSLAWDGRKIGAGSMTNIECRPNDLLRFKLEFLRPLHEIAEAQFVFKPAGGQTEVTWSITGTNSFMRKLMGLVMNFDRMIGSAFSSGLASLKSNVESSAAA